MELMKQIHHFKKGLVIILKGATFSDFIETRLWNYKPLAIQIRFPLFCRIFFQLGSNLIKLWLGSSSTYIIIMSVLKIAVQEILVSTCFIYNKKKISKRNLLVPPQNQPS